MIRDSFIKLGRETKSPFITNPFRFAGVEWATALTNWLKRKPLTINGAAKTPTFEEDWASTPSGQTIVGSQVTESSNRINFAFTLNNVANSYSLDLANVSNMGANLDDEKFVVRFKMFIQDITSNATGQFVIMLSDTANAQPAVTSQNSLGIYTDGRSSDDEIFTAEYTGTSITLGSEIESMNGTGINLTRYVEFKRESQTVFRVTFYSDSSYSTVVGTSSTVTAKTTHDALRYFSIGIRQVSGKVGDFEGYIDDLKVYNGVTTVENIPSQQTATFSDDFSSDNWTDVGTLCAVNTSTQVLDFDVNDNGVEHSTSYDVGIVSDEKWTLRWKHTVDAKTQNTTADISLFVGLASNLAESRTATDCITLFSHISTSNAGVYGIRDTNGTGVYVTGSDASFSHALTAETIYVELKRTSSTTYECSFYSDSDYKTLIETKTGTVSASTVDLRYIRVFNDSEGSSNSDHVYNGTIDNIKFYNNVTEVNPTTLTDYPLPIKIIGDTNLQRKTAETRDEPFTADGWVDTGSNYGVDITNEVLNWNATDSSANNGSAYDLTSVSNSAWTLDFDLFSNVTAGADATANVTHFGISGESQATAETTSQDYIGMRIKRGSTVNEIAIIQSENPTAPSGGTSSAFTLTAQDLDGKTVFVRIQRLSTTAGAIMIFADSAHTILLERKDLTLPSGLDTLRYLRVFSGATQDSTENSTLNGTVKNLKFWNGITNPVTQETPTLDDDFSGTDNWTDTGTDFAVNTTTDVIDWNSNEGNVTHLTYYDLGAGAVSDENWVIRYPLNIANISDGTVTASAQFYGGISDSTTGFGATQNGVFFTIRRSTVTDDYSIFATENETVSTDGGEQFTRTPTAETVYVEIIRKNDSITINQYSDSNYSILLESLTRTTGISAITGLRYLIFFNRDNSATINATLNGTINEVSFWNGISSPNAEGRKFVFTNDAFDGDAVEYASEAVSYDPINGDWTGYVKIPSLTAGADTTIQMYYDYSAANPSYVPEVMPIAKSNSTYSDQFTSDNSVSTGTDVAVDASTNNRLDFNFHRLNTDQDSLSLDLGENLNNATFYSRFKLVISSLSEVDSTNARGYIGFSDLPGTSAYSASHDFIGLYYNIFNGTSTTNTLTTNGAALGTTPTDDMSYLPTAETLYVEIIRTSTTSFTINLYSDSTYTTIAATQVSTVSASTVNLRYFYIARNDNSGGSNNIIGYIDDLEVFNNITSYPSREQSTYDLNYKAVHHLQGNSTDSTAYGNDGTDTSVDWEQQNNSVGLVADGANTKVDSGSDTSVDDMLDNGGHVSVWINPKSDGEGSSGRIIGKGSGWFIETIGESGGFVKLEFTYGFDTTDAKWETAAIVPINTLTKVDVYYNDDGSSTPNPTMWINGLKYTVDNGGLTETSTGSTSSVSDASGNLIIGNNSGSTLTFDGLIDEARVSDKQRLSSEVITTYNAEKSDSDIITKGDELTQ